MCLIKQILIKLAVEEPGANWDHETYTHARGTPAIQGWLLPESWTREDEEMNGDGGPRRAGILCVRYITDAVRQEHCCTPKHFLTLSSAREGGLLLYRKRALAKSVFFSTFTVVL